EQWSPLPGNGISRAEKKAPNVARTTDQRSQRPRWSYKNPAKSGYLARLQEISTIARVRGGGRSPNRTRLHLEFPANREINREFRQNRQLDAILHADTPANSEACSEIPYSTEQGIFAKEQGILDCTRRGEQGFCLLKTEIVAG